MTIDTDLLERIKNLSQEKEWQLINELVKGIHPYDLSELILELDKEIQLGLIINLPKSLVSEILPQLPEEKPAEILMMLPSMAVQEILINLSPDDLADILISLPEDKREEILGYFPEEDFKTIKELMKHPQDSAGGIMTPEVLTLKENMSVEDTIEFIRKNSTEFETIYYLYVTDQTGILVGVVSLRELVLAKKEQILKDIMNPDVIKVPKGMDQEEVARLAADYDLATIPVVSRDNKILGIVTIDDVIDVIEEEIVEDMGLMAGAGEEIDKLIDANTYKVVRARLPWLIFALIGDGIIASGIYTIFQDTIEAVILLAAFIPVIMTMGGNVGVQSSTVFVRGLATGEIEEPIKYFFREAKVGFILGIIVGVATGIFGQFLLGSSTLGLIVGFSMFLTILIASSIGIIIPKFFDSIGIDPAISSSPFITTLADILGLFVYFGLATWMIIIIGI